MTLKKRLTPYLPVGRKRTKLLAILLLSICMLFCGFVWEWVIQFSMPVLFPVEEAIDSGLMLDFSSIVNADDLQTYLTEPLIAEELIDGVRANLSGNVYSSIEIPDMREESLGSKIIRIIFDRIFS
jgi:hypothetical protein